MDTITHEDELWLVPEWIEHRDEKWSQPRRIISIARVAHQPAGQGGKADYIVNNPIPQSVMDGEVPTELRATFRVIEKPDIRMPYLPDIPGLT